MPLPEIPGVVRVTAAGNVSHGGRWTNTMHFQRTDLISPTEAEIDLLDADLVTFYTNGVLDKCHVLTTLDTTAYTPLDGTSGATVKSHSLGGSSGAATSLPPECSIVLTLRTAARGRRARGRIYLPAFSQAGSADGILDGTLLADLLAAANAMNTAALADGWEIGVASYGRSVKTNFTVTPKTHVVTTWAPFFTRLTSFSADNVYDVMRNRKS